MHRLRPTQIVGIAAILLFGSRLAVEFAKPQKDPFDLPGAQSISAAALEPAGPAELTERGSDKARDDLYCSGILFSVGLTDPDRTTDAHIRRLDYVVALAISGANRLRREGSADEAETGAIANALSTQAAHDFKAGTPRIPVQACMDRGSAAVAVL